jgi:hypothetical protein
VAFLFVGCQRFLLCPIEPLPIRVQFQSLSVKVGEDTSFGVDVDGESHMSYQYRWFKDDKPITATSSAGKIYHLGPVSEDMAGTYYCEVSNSCGQKETVPVAQITINQGMHLCDITNGLTLSCVAVFRTYFSFVQLHL